MALAGQSLCRLMANMKIDLRLNVDYPTLLLIDVQHVVDLLWILGVLLNSQQSLRLELFGCLEIPADDRIGLNDFFIENKSGRETTVDQLLIGTLFCFIIQCRKTKQS